jgi:hypothetical protein
MRFRDWARSSEDSASVASAHQMTPAGVAQVDLAVNLRCVGFGAAGGAGAVYWAFR